LRLLALSLLPALLIACAAPPSAPPPPAEVQCQRIQPMPQAARQPPTPEWCSPTCLHGWNREVETLRALLDSVAPPAPSASASGTR
jgi:hypothetical protein